VKIAKAIEKKTNERKLNLVGKIAYDTAVTKAQIAAKTIVEYSNNSLREQILSLWESTLDMLKS